MADYTRLGGAGSFDSFNWELNGQQVRSTPGLNDAAIIAAPGTYSVTLSTSDPGVIVISNPNVTLGTFGFPAQVGYTGVQGIGNFIYNSGTVSVGAGSTLLVGAFGRSFGGPAFASGGIVGTGSIIVGADAVLHVVGSLSAAQVNGVPAAGGTIIVDGLFDNTGFDLTPQSFAGNAVILRGTIHGGAIAASLPFVQPGQLPTNAVPVLDGVTVVGALEASADWVAAGAFRVVAADGVSPGTLSIDAGQLLLASNATLDGFTIDITGSGQSGGIGFAGTTTLGPSLDIIPDASVPGVFFTDTPPGTGTPTTDDMLINQATITASVLLGLQAVHLVNEGVVTNLGTRLAISLTLPNNANPFASFVNSGSLFSVNGTLGIYNSAVFPHESQFSPLPFTNTGLVAVSGGTLAISAGVTGDGTIAIANGSTAHIPGGYGNQTFGFIGSGNTLSLDSIGGSNVVLGFAPGDTLDLSQPALSGSYADGVLAIEQIGRPFASFIMGGAPANAQFSIVQDPNNHHTYITETIPCFAAGTRIGTPRGEVPVEQLRVGDQVLSGFGGTVPIVWIGRRTLWPARSPDPASLWPVRIRAGALGRGIPARDLLVSAEHAIHLDGVLVPAGLLLNGHGIVRAPCREITYLHVELPQHDLLLAEGAACESYLDTGNRADFGGAVVAMHPSFGETPNAIWLARACAPQCRGGKLLAAIRARLDRPAGNAAGAKA